MKSNMHTPNFIGPRETVSEGEKNVPGSDHHDDLVFPDPNT